MFITWRSSQLRGANQTIISQTDARSVGCARATGHVYVALPAFCEAWPRLRVWLAEDNFQMTTTLAPVDSNGDLASLDAVLEQQAFHRFPYALLVVDSAGGITCRNLEASRLIEATGLPEVGLTCCALLGCRVPGSVLAAACLTELAITHKTALPEVRVDVLTPDGARAIWVAAAPLGEDASQVVLQLRPGVAQDRRRRTDPHWMEGPKLRINTLGATVVESAEGPIGGAWLDQRTGELLKYLVTKRDRAVPIDEIGESIWPGSDYAIAGSVRYYIHALRRMIEPQRGRREASALIVSRAGRYRLNLEHIEVDADAFEAHMTAGLAANAETDVAVTEIERGIAVYRGEFLADVPHAEWAMAERDRLHDLACTGLRSLAEIFLKRELIDDATRSLERLATLQPYDEDVYRQLIELDIMQGRPSDAMRRYAALRVRMNGAYGRDPDFAPTDFTSPTP
jgi:DNA-binding SARP family transcriptional activator